MTTTIEPSKQGVLLLTGYGIALAVERGQLRVSDGIGTDRRSGIVTRIAAQGIRRVIVIGHSGFISFEAVRWLCDVGIGFVQLDYDGNILLCTTPIGGESVKLRRAQAVAPFTDDGMAITRFLLETKLRRQADVIARYDGGAAQDIGGFQTRLATASSLEALRLVEAHAAIVYWNSLAPRAFPFSQKDTPRVPAHWRIFGGRISPLSGSPRKAVTPFHAMLNYLYALLETEAAIALRAVGFDPALGILHSDVEYRASFACDVMEAIRPDVDAWLLDTLATRVFAAKDFVETREGQCRLMPPLARHLAETSAQWRAVIIPIVEHITARFLTSEPPPTLHQAVQAAKLPRTCKRCGTTLAPPRKAFCSDDCRLATQREHRRAQIQALHAALEPATAAPPPIAPRIAHARPTADDSDRAAYRRDILPGLAAVPTAALRRATGLSYAYCKRIRQGNAIPHPQHWPALAALVAAHAPPS